MSVRNSHAFLSQLFMAASPAAAAAAAATSTSAAATLSSCCQWQHQRKLGQGQLPTSRPSPPHPVCYNVTYIFATFVCLWVTFALVDCNSNCCSCRTRKLEFLIVRCLDSACCMPKTGQQQQLLMPSSRVEFEPRNLRVLNANAAAAAAACNI